MRTRAVALALLVVGTGLVGVLPPNAAGGTAVSQPTPTQAHASADRAPPELPEQWQRTYGTSGDDTLADVVRTADGGYLLVGSAGEDTDGWLLKVDGEGREEWSKTLGGQGTDRFRGVVRLGDGERTTGTGTSEAGFLVAGQTSGDDGTPQGWLVEVGPDGEVRSERTVGAGSFSAVARSESGDGYVAAGWTYGDGKDGWLVGLDADGSESWESTVSPPEGYGDGFLRAVVPTDSGYYLAGKVAGDSDDGWALRVDEAGAPEWQTAVGGTSRDDVWAAAPAGNGSDDGFVLAGETESDSDGPRDGWLVKFGPEGEVDWERKPGGEGTQWLDSAMRTEEGYLFTGSSDQGPYGSADGYVLATDGAGEPRWESYYGTDSWDKPWPAVRAHGDGYLLAGQTSGGDAGGKDGWLVRIGAGSAAGETTSEDGERAPNGSSSDEGTTDASGDTTAEAMRGETPTATDSPASVPGFGVGAALVALAGLLVALRR